MNIFSWFKKPEAEATAAESSAVDFFSADNARDVAVADVEVTRAAAIEAQPEPSQQAARDQATRHQASQFTENMTSEVVRVLESAQVSAQSPATEQNIERRAVPNIASPNLAQNITPLGAPLAFAPQPYGMNEPRRFRDYTDPRSRPYSPLTVDTLRQLAQSYDVLAACVAHLKDQVIKTPLRIAPVDDKDQSATTAKQVKEATAWFDVNGGLGGVGTTRLEFEGRWLDDLLIIGAGAFYFDFATAGAWMDNTPDSVLAIDASTIRPLVTPWGFAPDDESPAFEQVVQGMSVARFRRRELMYQGLPIFAQSHSPYFQSPIELAALVIMTALKSDEWNRTWLTDGNVPDAFIAVPKEWTPDQIEVYSGYFDALLAGNSRERRRAKVVPDGVSLNHQQSRKDADFQAFEQWMMERVCSVCGVNPASIGHHGDTYKDSQDIARTSTRENRVAQLLLFRTTLYNELCRRKGWDRVRVADMEPDAENAQARASRLQSEIGSGQKTINEARQEIGLEAQEGGDVLLIGSNLVPLSRVIAPPQETPQEVSQLPDGSPDGSPDENASDDDAGSAEQPQNAQSGLGDDEKDDEKKAERVLDVSQDVSQSNVTNDSVSRALKQWERKCLNRLARGQVARCDFSDDAIGEELEHRVLDALNVCESKTDVRAAFDSFGEVRTNA